MGNFVAPAFEQDAFTCPHCGAFSQQRWGYLVNSKRDSFGHAVTPVSQSTCQVCGEDTFWLEEELLYPSAGTVPPPNEALSDGLKEDYREAREIVARSPRGAAALLRLLIQKLCAELGESGKNIDRDIGSLVAKQLISARTQKALDAVRVIGNESVHPGTIDLRDDRELADTLFSLVNIIAQEAIADETTVNRAYANLPPDKLAGIANRDKKAPKPSTC